MNWVSPQAAVFATTAEGVELVAAVQRDVVEVAVTDAPSSLARPSTLGTLVRLVFGGLLASVGGLFVLAVVASFAMDKVAPGNGGNVVFGTLILALPPLLIGLLIFRSGARRLTAHR